MCEVILNQFGILLPSVHSNTYLTRVCIMHSNLTHQLVNSVFFSNLKHGFKLLILTPGS